MSDTPDLLPPQFAELEPFARVWGGIDDSVERFLLRQHTSQGDIKFFYDAMAPRLEEVFQHLDRFGPEENLPPKEKALYLTSLGLAEVSLDIELFGGPQPFLPKDYRMHIEWIEYDVNAASHFQSFGDQ
jgi:hypothetical protein